MYVFIYCQPVWLVGLVILIAGIAWTWGAAKLSLQRQSLLRCIRVVLLVGCIVAIGWVTLIRTPGIRGICLIPFESVIAGKENTEVYRSMTMNLFLFIPFGLMLSDVLPQRWSPCRKIILTTLWAGVLSCLVECAQYCFALGTTETDDVICNTLGGLLGAAHILLVPLFQKESKRTTCH